MSVSKIKNLSRRLTLLESEASRELNNICKNNLWESLGFEVFDEIHDQDQRAKANYYFGQLQATREIQNGLKWVIFEKNY